LKWILRLLKFLWAAIPPSRQRRLKVGGIVALIILVPLQIYLKFGLTPLVQKYAIPQAEKTLGVPIKADSVAVSLLGIKTRVSGLAVGNPTGFTEPTALSLQDLRVNLGPSHLLAGVTEISSARIQGLRLTIIRDNAGETNIARIQQAAGLLATGAVVSSSASAALPQLQIGNVRADAVLEYIDYQVMTNVPFRIAYAMTVKAHDIRTYKPWVATNHWGTFSVDGHLENDPQSLRVNLKGKIAPILDPHTPSFEINGTITNLNAADLGPMAVEAGIQNGSLAADVHVVCKNGVFQRESVVTVHLDNLKIAGGTAKRLLGTAIPSSVTAAVQLKGTVDAPDFDLLGTLLRTTGKGLSHGVNAIMDGADSFFKWLSRPATNQKASSSSATTKNR
jgi:hypothetical protein